MDGLEQDIQYRDMKIFYNINLISYQNVIKEKDYYSFSRIEIASNLLCGDIILLDKEKAFSLSNNIISPHNKLLAISILEKE